MAMHCHEGLHALVVAQVAAIRLLDLGMETNRLIVLYGLRV